jgi:hypothetical protein
MTRPGWSVKTDVQMADMLVHEAGHAVVAWELGLEIVHLRFSSKDWSGRMPFLGGLYRFEGDPTSERAREAAEQDMLVFHAGLMAQRLFHYESTHHSVPAVDLLGVWDSCHALEDDVALIDEWSDYIEERVRVMLYKPATWARVVALAPEIARRLFLPGSEIAAFLDAVDVTGAVSPHRRPWKRAEYAFGRDVESLPLSNRARGALNRAEIDTVAELLTYSSWDLRMVWRTGAKTIAEIEAALASLGLHLAEERRGDREARVQRARREERESDRGLPAAWERVGGDVPEAWP